MGGIVSKLAQVGVKKFADQVRPVSSEQVLHDLPNKLGGAALFALMTASPFILAAALNEAKDPKLSRRVNDLLSSTPLPAAFGRNLSDKMGPGGSMERM